MNNLRGVLSMTEQERSAMLQQIWDELRYVRAKLDKHVDDNDRDIGNIKKDFSKLSEELKTYKVKLGFVIFGASLFSASIISFVVEHVFKV